MTKAAIRTSGRTRHGSWSPSQARPAISRDDAAGPAGRRIGRDLAGGLIAGGWLRRFRLAEHRSGRSASRAVSRTSAARTRTAYRTVRGRIGARLGPASTASAHGCNRNRAALLCGLEGSAVVQCTAGQYEGPRQRPVQSVILATPRVDLTHGEAIINSFRGLREMSDRITGGHHSRTVTLRRLGWLGAVTLLGAALLIPGTAAAAFSSPKCGCSHTSTTSTVDAATSTETSDVSETTSTQITETTETSDVSETTSTQSTADDRDLRRVGDHLDPGHHDRRRPETGGVGGETGTPDVTPPSTSSLPGSSGSSDGWRVILLALAGIAVLSLILLPGDRKRSQR